MKFTRFAIQSYVDDNGRIKWCPAPHCNYAIAVQDQDLMDVECMNLHRFCWECKLEGHYPLECKFAKKWLKLSQDEESTKWKITNARECPSCKKPIHKDGGCTHITCVCKYEFCWLCLGKWTAFHRGELDPCVPMTFSVGVQEELEAPPSEYEAYYKKHFSLRGEAFERSKTVCNTELVNSEMAWFQIRKCMSISRWVCAFACEKNLDPNLFIRIKEEAEDHLEMLIYCALGSRPELDINNWISKTNVCYEEMVARLKWEADWNQMDF